MIDGRVSLSFIESIRFHQTTIGNVLLQGFHHFPRQYVGTMRLAGVQFDGDFSRYLLADFRIDIQQAIGADIFCKKYLCISWR